jgi:phenylpropionate dioxygenase-like ring-hydroxylating dioxygenase large terminal subunit
LEHPRIVQLIREAWAAAHAPDVPFLYDEGTVPTTRYTDAERLARERTALFRAMPIPLAHASELTPGGMLVRDVDGISIALTRTPDGVAHAFKNACRHRGVRLVREDCRAKAFVCPYHGWTYGTDGKLLHVPHPGSFPTCDLTTKNLVPVNVEERHGLLWVSLDPRAPDVRTHLGELDEELASFGLGAHVIGSRVVREHRGNWKFLMEGFLDGYHIRTLHRDTVYPYFLDARSVAKRSGLHIRTATARRGARDLKDDAAFAATPLRDIATVGYMILPSTNVIAHPDWTSLVVLQPLATDRFSWSHIQLLPEEPKSPKAREHFARSFALIDGEVFEKEDLLMCAEAQKGLETGANELLTFGRLDAPALWLHDAIDQVLARPPEHP